MTHQPEPSTHTERKASPHQPATLPEGDAGKVRGAPADLVTPDDLREWAAEYDAYDRRAGILKAGQMGGGQFILQEAANLIDRLRADNGRLREALIRTMIGGNHLAVHIDLDRPDWQSDPGIGLAHYGPGIRYDIWCCWREIMAARAALEPGA